MAQEVVSYFNKTYFGTSKLAVELAFSKGSNDKGDYRPWSKYSAGSSRHDSINKKNDDDDDGSSSDDDNGDGGSNNNAGRTVGKKQQDKIDKKKEEFLEVMLGRKKGSGRMWGNDDGRGDNHEQEQEQEHDDSDNDNSQSSSSAPTSSDEEDEDDSRSINDKNHEKSDKKSSTQKEEGVQNDDDDDNSYSSERLFIRNLPFHATEDEIKEVFSNFGKIVECHIPIDDSNRSKGYAFVKFASSHHAKAAREQLDGSSFQGRLIHVLRARPERDTTDNTGGYGGAGGGSDQNGSTMTHKQKMEQERKTNAENATKGWSSNFVRGDAVVDNIADRFGMEKGDVLNVKDSLSSGNAAVRLALGETQVLEENREYFRKHGIQMDALVSAGKPDQATKRSSTMILVKNLPYETSHDELTKLFLGYGGDATILLPPSKTIALVKYMNINDAKKAFRKLAYRRFKHVPLYLEWAPLGVEQLETSPANGTSSESHSNDVSRGDNEISHDQDDDDEDEVEELGQNQTTIYVKNLKFSTSETEVKKVFQDVVGNENILSVRIPTKVAPVKASNKSIAPKVQSMGYGFVECRSEDAARKAIKSLQGKIINGHAMELKVSSKSSSAAGSALSKNEKKKGTKLMVRNVPFQASRTEILQLFGSFGQLKTVRLPKKFDGGHRGFAFVEFTSVKEAQNAMKTLSQTHLYGRHLVIEWSNEKEDNTQSGVKHKADGVVLGNNKSKRIKFA